MTAKLRKKRKNCFVANRVSRCRFDSNRTERVIRELDALTAESAARVDPVQEHLRQCPEAFQAGELLGKLFDRQKYESDGASGDRCLPPAGAVMPPLV
jgi:hypothetical protein